MTPEGPPSHEATAGRGANRLIVIRHAQSEWNATGRWQGSADPPLSTTGEEQARCAGSVIARCDAPGPITSVWSSDLQRARQTAAILAETAGWSGRLREVPDLREHDVGEWSGLTHGEIVRRWPGLLEAWGAGRLAATPGGELRDAFDRRVRRGLRHVIAAARHDGAPPGVSVVVTHGGVLRAVARWLDQPEQAMSQLEGYVLAAGRGSSLSIEAAVALLGVPGDAKVAG